MCIISACAWSRRPPCVRYVISCCSPSNGGASTANSRLARSRVRAPTLRGVLKGGCGGDREWFVEECARDRWAKGEAVEAGRSERGELVRGADAWIVNGSRIGAGLPSQALPACRRRPWQQVVSHDQDSAEPGRAA